MRNAKAIMLMARPYLPRDHRLGGNGAPQVRRQIRQTRVIAYEKRNATPPRELVAFSATVDPRLIRDSSAVMSTVRQIARSGMSHPGATYESHVDPGRPRSRAKDLGDCQSQCSGCAYYRYIPELPRRCGDLVNDAALDQNHQDGGHDAAASVALSRVVEQLDGGLAGPRIEQAFNVTQAEYQGGANDEERHHVIGYAPGDGYWDDPRSIYGLLGFCSHNISERLRN